MSKALQVISLEDLGMLRVRGGDAVPFLQGQLSNDIARLDARTSMLAGYHNPQGRAIALLRLLHWDTDDILAVVPRELAGVVASRLGKYVLRAKVKITDESAAWRVSGLIGSADGSVPAELPVSVNSQVRAGRAMFVRVADEPARWLAASPAEELAPADGTVAEPDTWRRLDIAAGLPQVYAVTSEEFVAQMLNLDVLNAIAFDKGCYTGQEVIARAHYRGRVKRRMQRYVSRAACQLAAGDSGHLTDGRAFQVVLAAQLADGRCDFLAVAPLAGAQSAETAVTAPLAADQVSLPYSLPD